MKIYEVRRNPDVYSALYCIDDSDYRLIEHFLGYYPYDKAPKVWQSISVGINSEYKKGDFPSLWSCFVFSSRARKILQPLIGNSVEYLDLQLGKDSDEYAIAKIKQRTDCLDYLRAEVKRFESSGRVMMVIKYAFKQENLENKHFFNIPEQRARVYASEEFKNSVESNTIQI